MVWSSYVICWETQQPYKGLQNWNAALKRDLWKTLLNRWLWDTTSCNASQILNKNVWVIIYQGVWIELWWENKCEPSKRRHLGMNLMSANSFDKLPFCDQVRHQMKENRKNEERGFLLYFNLNLWAKYKQMIFWREKYQKGKPSTIYHAKFNPLLP